MLNVAMRINQRLASGSRPASTATGTVTSRMVFSCTAVKEEKGGIRSTQPCIKARLHILFHAARILDRTLEGKKEKR